MSCSQGESAVLHGRPPGAGCRRSTSNAIRAPRFLFPPVRFVGVADQAAVPSLPPPPPPDVMVGYRLTMVCNVVVVLPASHAAEGDVGNVGP